MVLQPTETTQATIRSIVKSHLIAQRHQLALDAVAPPAASAPLSGSSATDEEELESEPDSADVEFAAGIFLAAGFFIAGLFFIDVVAGFFFTGPGASDSDLRLYWRRGALGLHTLQPVLAWRHFEQPPWNSIWGGPPTCSTKTSPGQDHSV